MNETMMRYDSHGIYPRRTKLSTYVGILMNLNPFGFTKYKIGTYLSVFCPLKNL